MFLNYLKERNKENFLKLCVYAAVSNGVFATKEEEMLGAYCREMNMPQNIPDTSDSLEYVLADIVEHTDELEKNIIVMEILGLVKIDGVYDDKEKDFMKNLIDGLMVKECLLNKMNSLLDIYTVVCKELYATITE